MYVLWLASAFHYLSIAFNLNGTIILHNVIKRNYEICYGKLYLNNLYNCHHKPLNSKWFFVNMAKIWREFIRCKWDNLMLWPPPWLEGIIVDERRRLVCHFQIFQHHLLGHSWYRWKALDEERCTKLIS